MKTMRLGIIALMVSALLYGCTSNKTAPTNEVLDNDISAVTSEETTPTSGISFSDGETADETTSMPETGAEPTKPKKDAPANTSKPQPSTSSSATNKPTDNSKTPSSTTTKPESSQNPAKTNPPEEKPKSAFAKPFDVATMKSELIAYGTSIGMTHITNFSEDFGGGQIKPDGTTWLPPHETWMYDSSSASKLKQDLCDRIKRWKNEGEKTFTLWFEKDSKHSGDYIIYVIIA